MRGGSNRQLDEGRQWERWKLLKVAREQKLSLAESNTRQFIARSNTAIWTRDHSLLDLSVNFVQQSNHNYFSLISIPASNHTHRINYKSSNSLNWFKKINAVKIADWGDKVGYSKYKKYFDKFLPDPTYLDHKFHLDQFCYFIEDKILKENNWKKLQTFKLNNTRI